MKRTRPASSQSAPLAGFPEQRITKLLNSIRSSLGASAGRPLTYEDLAMITGRPANTLADWCEGGPTPQLSALFCMLEQLPQVVRHQLVDHACRILPSILDPRIAHDFHAVEGLTAILSKRTGLTVITGEPEHARTFIISALAQGHVQQTLQRRCLAGLDIHPAREFVPVPGVLYRQNPLLPDAFRARLTQAWREILEALPAWVLLNGVLNVVPSLSAEAISLSEQCHVLIADQENQQFLRACRAARGHKHIISASVTRHQPGWIQLAIREF